jgi:hypothetical protein
MASRWLARKVFHSCIPSGWRGVLCIQRRTVRSEISKPSIFSSPWMRGAPHVGFSATIRKMSSRISLLVAHLPTLTLGREIHFQYSVNPARCQRATVSGCTRINAFRHPDQMGRSVSREIGGYLQNLGCGRGRARTASCCRNAGFSKSRSRRARYERTNTRNISLRRHSIAALYHRKHNRVNADRVLARVQAF